MNRDVMMNPDLTSKAKLIYAALCLESRGMPTASVSVEDLTLLTSLADATVRRALKELIDEGVIEREARDDEFGRPMANQYTFL